MWPPLSRHGRAGVTNSAPRNRRETRRNQAQPRIEPCLPSARGVVAPDLSRVPHCVELANAVDDDDGGLCECPQDGNEQENAHQVHTLPLRGAVILRVRVTGAVRYTPGARNGLD